MSGSLPRARRGTAVAAALTCVAAALGCTDLTRVDAPDLVQPPALNNPQGATALYSGAVTLFASAYNGSSQGLLTSASSAVMASGLVSDELGNAALASINDGFDSRNVGEAASGVGVVFAALSQARVNALAAAQVMQGAAPTPASRIGQLFALAGYSEILLAELYCSGSPLTEVEDGRPVDYGTPLSTTDLFLRAASDFDSALVYAADSARILNLARVGKARALLNLGRFSDAAAAAAPVPTTYSYITEHSSAIQPNNLASSFTGGTITVSEREGQNGLDFRTAADPRVRAAFLRTGTDRVTAVWHLTTLAAGAAAPTVLASGIEARLIQAEAALQSGDASGWLNTLNTLRATVALAPLADPGTTPARVNLHFRERAFWLFATAHRQGDLRRLVRQYTRVPETVFPTGPYRAGRTYGPDVTIAPPTTEGRNPNYTGCLSREA